MTPLYCSSMAHVVDRAWAFLFAQPPYQVVEVRPNGVILSRPDSEGIKGETLHFVVAARFPWNIATDYAINASLLEKPKKRRK